ncbi:MAG: 3-oxoacyl-ACP reductase FabG [Candidatus Hodarchaeaceae archaeon]|nr:3-oxoacyl-ACP reductase FabG [Candidatus Hodarchaeaceae archaeon]
MKAKLISYTDVAVPTPPYRTSTKSGIVEDEEGKRLLVRIEDEYYPILKIGMEGEVEERRTDFGTFNFFIPAVKKEEKRKVAIVTGASRGIGKAIAFELARSGFDVVISDIEKADECEENMKRIKELGRESIFVKADVSDFNQVENMVKETVEKFGRVDVLINNAGLNIDKLVTTMTLEQWQKVIDVDLNGVFNCTKAILPYMIQQGGGRIVNVSSMSALDGAVGQANYAAAKGGIISFTKVIAKEYAQYNILCNAIAPGFIRTRMTDAMPPGLFRDRLARNPLGRRGEPEEVAKLVRFLVTEGDYITGQVIGINAGEYV